MKTTSEKIAVMQAFEDGKTVEAVSKSSLGPQQWLKVNDPTWNWFATDYRVRLAKPSINWDHVHEKHNFMATDMNGHTYLYEEIPYIVRPTSTGWTSSKSAHRASMFASFVAGECDWKDSLVQRPS